MRVLARASTRAVVRVTSARTTHAGVMLNGGPLATRLVSFFDTARGISALAVVHIRRDGRTALVYHDAPGVAAARPVLSAVAGALTADLGPGQTLGIVESSIPENAFEPFVYARVILSGAAWPGAVNAGTGRVLGVPAVAAACGIDVREVERTEALVTSVHRPRACAFPGFRQLPLRDRPAVLSVA